MKPYYDDGTCVIYHGDCREILPGLAADVMVTDPPYGVGYSSGWDNQFGGVGIAGDDSTESRDRALEIWGDRPALVFGSWKQAKPPATRLVLIWDKGTLGMGDLSLPWFPCVEEIYVLGAGWQGTRTSAVMRVVGRNQYHPTEKPYELMSRLVAKCPAGTLIDPFLGSGTLLLAAKDHNRRAIGIEIEERYCEIAAKRLAQEVLPLETAAP